MNTRTGMIRFALCAGVCLGGATAVQADDHAVVVELFTSQGCSSCPAADELLEELADNQEIIALALHVDYWDYIGWVDQFAQPKFTDRQKNYARIAGARSIYTPQFIIGGVDHVVGAHPMEIAEGVRRLAAQVPGVDLTLKRSGEDLSVEAVSTQSFATPLIVQVVRYTAQEQIDILGGENAGKSVTYSNIVTSWEPVAEWQPDEPLTMDIDVPGSDPVVVIVQEPGPGLIVAAERAF